MIREDLLNRSFGQLLARLELVSHAPTVNLNPLKGPASDEDIGGKRPPGSDRERPNRRDSDEVASFLDSYHRKTVYYFRARLGRAHSPEAREALRRELVDVLEAWLVAPPAPAGIEPERGSFEWKCILADDERPLQSLLDAYAPISKATVYRYRAQYRGLRRHSVRSKV